jgi:hypothetical protein
MLVVDLRSNLVGTQKTKMLIEVSIKDRLMNF